MLKKLLLAVLIAVPSLASAIEFTILTTQGYVRFTVPDDWRVGVMQTKPPISIAAFQVQNPADEGTPHSTNVVVSLFHVETQRGLAGAASVGRQFGTEPPAVSTVDGWTIYSQEARENGALYTIIDAKKPAADVVVALRFAWPHLPNNASKYDETMRNEFESLRRSVSFGFGVPTVRAGEVVRRPTQ